MSARAALLLLATLGAGCASVPVERSFDEVREATAERIGHRVEWADVSLPAPKVEAAVRELLARPLDADRAAEVALLNNRRLQAAWAELGQAAAARTAAGLPANPLFEVVASFTEGDGRPDLELGIAQELLDLFLLPARRRAAAVAYEQARLELVGRAVDLAAGARATFLRYQAERQLLELERHALVATEAGWEMSLRLREAGNLSELALLQERDLYEQMRLQVAARELAVIERREEVNARLGLWGAAGAAWEAAPLLPELPPAAADPLAEAEARAVDRSLDLAGAVLGLELAARRAGLTDVEAIFPELEVGAEAERESEHGDDIWSYGPMVAFRIPLWDQGQARRAGARFEVRRQWELIAATAVEVRAAARSAAARVAFARQRAAYVQEVVLPVRSRLTEQSQLHYNGMFLGIFELLDARRREIEAGREWVESLRDYWLARGDLDRLLAGRLAPGGGGAGGAETSEVRRASAADQEDH